MSLADTFGVNWQPTSMGWKWGHLQAPGHPKLHILTVELPVGRLGLAFSAEDLAKFIAMAQSELTGLVMPESMDWPPSEPG